MEKLESVQVIQLKRTINVGEAPALTVGRGVIDEDCGLRRFSQDAVHRHTEHQLKRLDSLQLWLPQVVQDGDSHGLHADARGEVQVTTDAYVVETSWRKEAKAGSLSTSTRPRVGRCGRGLTFRRDGLSFARTDRNAAAFGQIGSCPPHSDLHVSVALVHVVLHLSKIKDWRWTTKSVKFATACSLFHTKSHLLPLCPPPRRGCC